MWGGDGRKREGSGTEGGEGGATVKNDGSFLAAMMAKKKQAIRNKLLEQQEKAELLEQQKKAQKFFVQTEFTHFH